MKSIKNFTFDTEKYIALAKNIKPIHYFYYIGGGIVTILLLVMAHSVSDLFLLGDLFTLIGFIWTIYFSFKNLIYVESRKKLKTLINTQFKKITG